MSSEDAAKKLTNARRRQFQATVAIDYLNSNSRKAERIFGWGRKTVEKGLQELCTGIECISNFKSRGNKNTEERGNEKLKNDILQFG